jgi:protein-tyrosine kinase
LNDFDRTTQREAGRASQSPEGLRGDAGREREGPREDPEATYGGAPQPGRPEGPSMLPMDVGSTMAARNRQIGEMLVAAGVLKPEEAERIAEYARREGLLFGEAAVRMKAVNELALHQVLAAQYDAPVLVPGTSLVKSEVICAYDATLEVSDDIRTLRNYIKLHWLDTEAGRALRTIAVMSPDRGEGRTFIASNLAVSFAQMGLRTLLIDGDMRHGRVHELFGLNNSRGLSAVLSGRASMESVYLIHGLPGLSVMCAGPLPPNANDLLARPVLGGLLNVARGVFDVIIFDTPAGLDKPDGLTIAAACKAALLLAKENASQAARLSKLSKSLTDAGVKLVGAAMNEF